MTVALRVTNPGTSPITGIRITSAALIGRDALLILPADSFSLGAGRSQLVFLSFWPLNKGQTGALNLGGVSAQGSFSLSQRMTIP